MTDYDFTRRLVETVRVDAEVRARGRFGWLWRRAAAPIDLVASADGTRLRRFTKRAVMSAVSEAAERFTRIERERFLEREELPAWFWPWVEERARYWDAEVV